jgi:hypothetical protein
VIAGRIPLIVTATRENDLRRALALADEFKVKVIAAGASQAAPLAELLKARKLPLLVSVNFDPPQAGGFFGGTSDREKTAGRSRGRAGRPAASAPGGVPFALVSGHARTCSSACARRSSAGCRARRALRALTLSAAEVLGIADRTGSLDAGKAANVTVWSGDPLAKDARVKMVFVDGSSTSRRAHGQGRREEGRQGQGERRTSGRRGKDRRRPARAPAGAGAPTPRSPSWGATLLTAGPLGTIEKGTILVKDGKIAANRRERGAALGLAGGERDRPVRHARPHRRPLAHGVEGKRERVHGLVTAEVRVGDVIDHHDIDIIPPTGGRVTSSTCSTDPATHRRAEHRPRMRWGRAPADLVFKEAAARQSSSRWARTQARELQRARPEALPGHAHGRRGGDPPGGSTTRRPTAASGRSTTRRVKAAGPRARSRWPPRKDLRLRRSSTVLDGKVLGARALLLAPTRS